MSSFDNPKNVVGMGDILADVEDAIMDINELEKSVVTGIQFKPKEQTVDLAKEYSKEIEELGRKFNLGSSSKMTTTLGDEDNDKTDTRNIDDLLNFSPNIKKTSISYGQNSKPPVDKDSYKAPYNLVDDEEETQDDEVPTTYYPSHNARPSWSPNKPEDEQLNQMTNEERKQSHVNKVLGNMEQNNDDAVFVQKEDEEDEMARIMEQIDLLRNNLESEGVDLSRIPDVNSATSKKEAKAVLRILQIKNDRLRYCDFFEETILAVAYGLEGVFNGQREVLGSKIDLTGYSDTVKVKLRRMRYDTSNFVSGIMQGYNISSGWRIILEIMPSLFFYSRDRRLTAKDNLISDESYKKAMQDLQ